MMHGLIGALRTGPGSWRMAAGALAAVAWCSAVPAQPAAPATQEPPPPRLAVPVWLAVPWMFDEYARNNTGYGVFRLPGLDHKFIGVSDALILSYPGGRPPLDPADYPNVVVTGECHLVSVGPRALLTAGHCLQKTRSLKVKVAPVGKEADATCHPMKETTPLPTCDSHGCPAETDVALCVTTVDLAVPPGGFESVATIAPSQAGAEFSTRIPALGRCAGSPKLFGDSVKASWPPVARETGMKAQLAVTTESYPYTCDTDSGTAWLAPAGPSGRRVVAILVSGDKDASIPSAGAALADGPAGRWLQQKAAELNVEVCGLSNGLPPSTCRN
jgi:hypothetical protein